MRRPRASLARSGIEGQAWSTQKALSVIRASWISFPVNRCRGYAERPARGFNVARGGRGALGESRAVETLKSTLKAVISGKFLRLEHYVGCDPLRIRMGGIKFVPRTARQVCRETQSNRLPHRCNRNRNGHVAGEPGASAGKRGFRDFQLFGGWLAYGWRAMAEAPDLASATRQPPPKCERAYR